MSKMLFDAFRAILGRGMTQPEVNRINAAMEGRTVPDAPDPQTSPHKTGPDGIALIKRWEGCHKSIGAGRFQAYPDPGTGGKPWTIGWGATRGSDGKPITPGTVWTQAQCDEQLTDDLVRFEREVVQAIGSVPTTQKQFDALVSFHYNTGAIGKATLTRKHKAGDYAGARAEFGKWVNAGGRPLPGLVKRRADEAGLYGS
jgi:lysozyme